MVKFDIYYPDLGIRQEKNLIQHWQHLHGKSIKDVKARKEYLDKFGDYFTDASPLFKAISTGIIDCNSNFGVFRVQITIKK